MFTKKKLYFITNLLNIDRVIKMIILAPNFVQCNMIIIWKQNSIFGFLTLYNKFK